MKAPCIAIVMIGLICLNAFAGELHLPRLPSQSNGDVNYDVGEAVPDEAEEKEDTSSWVTSGRGIVKEDSSGTRGRRNGTTNGPGTRKDVRIGRHSDRRIRLMKEDYSVTVRETEDEAGQARPKAGQSDRLQSLSAGRELGF